MSYHSGGSRTPHNINASPLDVQTGSTNAGNNNASRLPRSLLARPVNYQRTGRALSLSSAEDSGTIPAPAPAGQPAPRVKRQSWLPRPNLGGLASTTPTTSTAPTTFDQILNDSIRPSKSSSDPAKLSQSLPPKKARNVLRRRAPTIGKHVEHSQKLSLVIPQTEEPEEIQSLRKYSSPDAYSAGPSASNSSSYSSVDKSARSALETPKTQEPVELASLRTHVETQNLPPPTNLFPSASSPSTRYSESPGMWSRGSTPTSLSSYSPGIVHSSKIGRMRQPSPSQTRRPVFSPPTIHPSPQSAQIERVEQKTSRIAIPQRALGQSPAAGLGLPAKVSDKPTSSILRGPPHSPPPRKSSVNFSPPKKTEVDTSKAEKEVEEAERDIFKSPELPRTSTESSAISPPRPSREGTHRLDLESFPIVKSDLPYLKSTGHKRQVSIEKAGSFSLPNPTPNQSATTSLDSVRSKDISRIPSREAGSPVMSRKSPKTLTKVAPKELSSATEDPKKQATPRRFGLFSKKSKPDLESTSTEPNRPTRKGPAAGTGHEGYAKYAQRGRKSSTGSNTGVRTRSTSTTRSGGQSVGSSKGSMSSRPELDLDDFLSSRLEPVVISGGGAEGASLSRTQSEQSMSSLSVTSSILPRQTSLTASTAQSTDSLASLSTGTPYEIKSPSDSSTALGSVRSRSPEKKASLTNRQQAKSRMPVPKGKKQAASAKVGASESQTSLSTGQSSSLPSNGSKTASGPSQLEDSSRDIKQVKKAKSSRWNPFQRGRTEEPTQEMPPITVSHAQLHAAIAPIVKSRPIAHYALVDTDSEDIETIVNHIEESPPTEEDPAEPPVQIPAGLNIRKRGDSILLRSPPKIHGEFQKDGRPSPTTAMFNRNLMGPESQASPEPERPRRLASVGRIPKVVSRRDRQHRPANASFSRPFSVSEAPTLPAPVQQGPSAPIFKDVHWAPNTEATLSQTQGWSSSNPNPARAALDLLTGPYSNGEFIHFSPHKDSVSSSSSGALAAVTAVVPEPGMAPMEDEIWNEYDDLIDHVYSPEAPKSKGEPPRSKGKAPEREKSKEDDRFELATVASRALQDELNNPNVLQSGHLMPGDGSVRSSLDSVRLRRSRIVSALHSSLSPSTQPSYSNLIASYEEMGNENPRSPANLPPVPTVRIQGPHSTFLQSLATTPASKAKDERKDLPSSSERDWDAVTRTNMRSASLMTSRWLSFGRVLFSPAHNHVKTGTHGRILVIDGLGNDDWSFYCSLTYPDAEVYSLSGRPVSTAAPHPAAWQPPTNHHTVYHAGLHNPLPFPKDYFTVTVLRFPVASPESVQSNIIQECKRVLRSGGYLEMSLLDRDMINMGVRTRRAVRGLKEMTYLADSSISLKPSSDNVQRILGTQGFDNLRRCMVRIPVSGMVVRSSNSTTSSSDKSFPTATTSSTAFSLPAISITTAGSQSTHAACKSSPSDDTNISLGDLLSDPSPSAANDESIAKIVARVGRWWYTKCYEDPVLPDTGDSGPSMWNDRKVLRECQKRGTGFRMLIAHAQKPSEVKRRTASV